MVHQGKLLGWYVNEEGFKTDLEKVRVITGDADP